MTRLFVSMFVCTKVLYIDFAPKMRSAQTLEHLGYYEKIYQV